MFAINELMLLILKNIRKQRGWTQSQVASKLNISKRFYQSIEAGDRKPSYKKINKLEDLFELPQRVLLAESVEEIPDFYKEFIEKL